MRVVFCDISKAFDRVWHRALLYKLSRFGCSEHLVKWFSSYLSNRRQCVILSGTKSEWAPMHAGVPQGSILGPLLFLIFINDIVKDISSSIRLFADYTSLYIIVENPQTAARLLNLDLDIISNWALDWLVDFHARKTMPLLLSTKLVPLLHFTTLHEQHSYIRIYKLQTPWDYFLQHMFLDRAYFKNNRISMDKVKPPSGFKYKINRIALEKNLVRFYTSST